MSIEEEIKRITGREIPPENVGDWFSRVDELLVMMLKIQARQVELLEAMLGGTITPTAAPPSAPPAPAPPPGVPPTPPPEVTVTTPIQITEFAKSDKWRWAKLDNTGVVSPNTESYPVYNGITAGYLYWFRLFSDNPDLGISISITAENTYEIRKTVKELYGEEWLYGPLRVTVYDEAHDHYVVDYYERWPGTPYKELAIALYMGESPSPASFKLTGLVMEVK